MLDALELWAKALTAVVGVVGVALTHSYTRRARVAIAEARLEVYGSLWELTAVAAPSRLELAGPAGGLSPSERRRVFERLTDWYYRDGNGLLLSPDAAALLLAAKTNLVCDADRLKPSGVLDDYAFDGIDDVDVKRGCLAIRQLSLLRTQLKSDLAVLGGRPTGRLSEHERRFLEDCGVSLWAPPWWGVAGEHRAERERQVVTEGGSGRPPFAGAAAGVLTGGHVPGRLSGPT